MILITESNNIPLNQSIWFHIYMFYFIFGTQGVQSSYFYPHKNCLEDFQMLNLTNILKLDQKCDVLIINSLLVQTMLYSAHYSIIPPFRHHTPPQKEACGGSFRRDLQSANPAQWSSRAGPPVYIGWNSVQLSILCSQAVRYGYSAERAQLSTTDYLLTKYVVKKARVIKPVYCILQVVG